MVEEANIILAFDLDGTIADYGEPVDHKVAKYLNGLGAIHIVTGATEDIAETACKLLTNKVIHAVRSWKGNKAIDVSKIMEVTKKHFIKTAYCQKFRKNLCLVLRDTFHDEFYIGGRATIDIMPIRNKGHVIRKLQAKNAKVIYFYDCKWSMNEEVNNDVPAIKEAWKSVRTDHRNIIRDVKACLLNI